MIITAFQAIEASAEIAERIVMSVNAVVDKVETWELAAPRLHGQKSLSESKCVSNLKILGSDKADFKNWNEKLINTIAQVLGTEWRKFLKNLNEKLDQDRKVISKSALSAINGAEKLENMDQANEDIF